MEKLIKTEDAISLDKKSINEGLITSLQMMENAALSCFYEIRENLDKAKKVLFLSGGGGNGADAIALARIAKSRGYDNLLIYDFCRKESEDRRKQKEIALNYGLVFTKELTDIDLIIDGLIGVGFKAELKEEYKTLIEKINNLKIYTIALDIPSGLSDFSNFCIKANKTITFGFKKLCMYSPKNRAKCGDIVVVNPSFLPSASFECNREATLYEISEYQKLKLNTEDYKNSKKHIAIFASSLEYQGTALLTCNAAFKTGIGLVSLFTVNEVINNMVSLNPGIIFHNLDEKMDLSKYDAILFGPGFKKNQTNILTNILTKYKGPVIIDAEGLHTLKDIKLDIIAKVIITPHLGELRNFMSFKNSEEYFTSLKTLSTQMTVVSKCDVVTIAENEKLSLVDGSNPALAIAGSGDILSSIITSFVSKNKSILDAVLLHQKAGKIAKEKYGFFTSEELLEIIGLSV